MKSQPAIEISGLVKRYGTKCAVDGLTLTVRRGEVFGFLGPNGAGKSTTIKMVCGLLRPTAGAVRILGRDASSDSPELKRSFGYLPENPVLYGKLTAREELDFVGRLFSIPPDVLARRMDGLLKAFGMTEDADRFLDQMSKGMKQKVALAQCLLHDPPVLMLDEPTSGLDPRAARMVKDLILGLKGKERTIFVSSHILDMASEVCDRMAVIHRGRLAAVGTASQIIKKAKASNIEEAFLNLTGGRDSQDLLSWREG